MKNRLLILLLILTLTACANNEKALFPNHGDIGSVTIPGKVVSFTSKKSLRFYITGFRGAMGWDTSTNYILSGAGANMWGTEDNFFMVWREVSGDFNLSADIAFKGEGANPHRKMGLIIRDGLAPDAVYADVAVHGDGLTTLQYRPEKGAETLEVAAGFSSGDPLPDHITLERKGNTITAGTSNSTLISQYGDSASIELELPETCYVGLFVCSHDADVTETAHFSDVHFRRR